MSITPTWALLKATQSFVNSLKSAVLPNTIRRDLRSYKLFSFILILFFLFVRSFLISPRYCENVQWQQRCYYNRMHWTEYFPKLGKYFKHLIIKQIESLAAIQPTKCKSLRFWDGYAISFRHTQSGRLRRWKGRCSSGHKHELHWQEMWNKMKGEEKLKYLHSWISVFKYFFFVQIMTILLPKTTELSSTFFCNLFTQVSNIQNLILSPICRISQKRPNYSSQKRPNYS